MIIGLIDPALYDHTGRQSPNIGDQIISRAVCRELIALFGGDVDLVRVPSHSYPTRESIARLARAQYVFVGGSNLLYFRWWWRASWRVGLWGLLSYRNLVLLGVGWGAYAIRPNRYGRAVCGLVLSSKLAHSVRDEYTRTMARDGLKIPLVLNTACPTMWRLTPELTDSIPTRKAESCVFSLTDYSRDPVADGAMLKELQAAYGDRLLFWPQGDGDIDYCNSLGYSGRVLDRSLELLGRVLESGADLDYVGTRLHAGVFCMEHKIRTLIVSIDNRAREIARDTGIAVVERGDIGGMREWVHGNAKTQVRLPVEAIDRWRSQFVDSANATDAQTDRQE